MILSHAYLFSGNDEQKKSDAIKSLAVHFLGAGYAHSPDFFTIDASPITIEEVRGLKLKASQSPLVSSKNIFLIKNIENLSRDAAPAMLKILEEPPQRCIIIATTDNTSALLPTIKSRFSVFRFWKKDSVYGKSGGDELEEKIKKALAGAEASARLQPTRNNVLRFEKLLALCKFLGDPTINKRLVGEYINMIL